MSDAIATTIVGNIATVVVAMIGALISYLTLRQGQRNGKVSEEIHVLTNSNLQELKKELAENKQELKDMRATMAEIAKINASKSENPR